MVPVRLVAKRADALTGIAKFDISSIFDHILAVFGFFNTKMNYLRLAHIRHPRTVSVLIIFLTAFIYVLVIIQESVTDSVAVTTSRVGWVTVLLITREN